MVRGASRSKTLADAEDLRTRVKVGLEDDEPESLQGEPVDHPAVSQPQTS
jgi:hypothetical protein